MKKALKIGVFTLVMVLVSAQLSFAQTGYGGSGRSSGTRVKDRVVTPAPQVLGAEKFVFNNDLRMVSTHSDVIELQKVLIKEGHLKIAAPTGYFGPLTFAAVKSYQAAHPEIGYVTGFFGPLTRAVMNK